MKQNHDTSFMIYHSKQKGISIVEVVIAITVVSIAFFAIAQVGILALKANSEKNYKTKALILAEEGMEIVRSIRDKSWSDNIETLNFGTTYYLTASSSQRVLTTTDPGLIDNRFTRTVVVDNAARDINDDIVSSGGTNDPKTKKVTVTISWGSAGKSIQLVGYIMDIFKN